MTDVRTPIPAFRIAAIAACLAACATDAGAEPEFAKLRFEEPCARTVCVGGSVRERYEYTRNPLFGADPQDPAGVWLQRLNLHSDIRLGSHVRLYGELSSALGRGREGGPGPVDEDQLEFQDAFIDLMPFGTDALTLRGGRQEIEFGSGRLVDVREGANVRRTFDGVRARSEIHGWDVSAVAARPRRERLGVFDDPANSDETLWGLYAARPATTHTGIDLYYLGFEDEAGAFVQGLAEETRHSLGTRLWGEAGGWDWNWEALYQFGTFGAGDISAWTLASETGRTFSAHRFSPRVGLRANIASGDKDAADPDLQTFNPLYPRGNYFSQAAVLGPRNFYNVNPHLGLQLTSALQVNTDVNFYWRLETADGVYSPSGQIIRAPMGSRERYVATGFSLETVWSPRPKLDFTAIFTHLEPGAFLRETGPHESIEFLELTARFRF